jgi:hypothetical protein
VAPALLGQTLDTWDICLLSEAELALALVLYIVALPGFFELPIPFPLPLRTTPAFFAACLDTADLASKKAPFPFALRFFEVGAIDKNKIILENEYSNYNCITALH